MATPSTQAGEIISETAKAEGGPRKGSLSAQMQSQLDKQQNAANGSSNSNKSEAGQIISEVAKAEGGTTKGSASAQLQSDFTKQQLNTHQGNQANNNAASTSKSAAGQLISKVAQAEGGTTKNSTSAKMQAEVTKSYQQGVDPTDALTDGVNNVNIGQPRVNTPQTATNPTPGGEKNFKVAAEYIRDKMENDPSSVTKEDAGYIHSREQRAHGNPEKGGISSVAHKLADQNEAR